MASTLTERVKTLVDAETLARLEALAAATDRTVSSVVRLAIRSYLNGKEPKL